MKLRNRLLLVGFGVVVFLIVTPALIMFARGFKFDLQSWQLIKTGTLVVRTEPEHATVFIDDKPQKNLTPLTIRFLLPGDYVIRIEKEGYSSWTKRLSIKSQLATWANANREFITLFLKQPQPETQAEVPKNEAFPISEGLIQAGQLSFTLQDSILFRQNPGLEKIYEPVREAYWDDESKRIVLSNNNEILLLDPLNDSPDLILRSVSEIRNARLNWHTGYMFFQNEGRIKAIELDGRDHRNVYTITDAGVDFTIDEKGERLYVMGQTEVKEYRIR